MNRSIFTVAAAACLLASTQAHAVSCNETIDLAGGRVTLDQNLQCATRLAAVRVIGPGTLDLGGHTISCFLFSPPGNGIEISGGDVRIRNGAVTNCLDGFVVQGEGSHTLENVVSSGNIRNGIVATSRSLRVLRSTVARNGSHGLDANVGTLVVRASTAAGNGIHGFIAFGTESLTFIDNVASANGDDGFQAVIQRTLAMRNNRAHGNEGDGIEYWSEDLRLERNHANGNGRIGIGGSAEGFIRRSTAYGNGLFDLSDMDAACVGTTWSNNSFSTLQNNVAPGLPDCIQ